MEKVANLGARLQILMEERELNYDKLGKLLEMKPQTLNRYVLGQREPKARVATEMAMRLDVDPLWLQGYNVPRSPQGTQTAPPAPTVPVLERFQPELSLGRQTVLRRLPAQVDDPERCFFLPVPDQSMIHAGLLPGDLVLLHSSREARSGSLVLCSVRGGEPVLRRLHLQGRWTILSAQCPGAVPRMFSRSELEEGKVKLLAVAVSLIRSLE